MLESKALEVPILPNFYGYSCLDYCQPGDVPTHHVDYSIFQYNKDFIELLDMSENSALGELVFTKISNYGFMHSSPFVMSALMDAIKDGESYAN